MLEFHILDADPAFNNTGEVNEPALARAQWGATNFLSNTTIMMRGLAPLASIAAANFTSVFVCAPEFGYYLRA